MEISLTQSFVGRIQLEISQHNCNVDVSKPGNRYQYEALTHYRKRSAQYTRQIIEHLQN